MDETERRKHEAALQSYGDTAARVAAAEAFGGAPDPAAVSLLVRALLRDAAWEVRRAAALSLARIRPAAALRPLRRALGDTDDAVGEAAAEALTRLGDVGADALGETLRTGSRELRRRAARALALAPAPIARRPLLEALHDTDPEVRAFAASGLGGIADPHALPDLAEVLRDPNDLVRRSAARAMVQFGAAALMPLTGALEQGSEAMRCLAADTLGDLGEPAAADALARATAAEADSVCVRAVLALGRLRNEAGLEALGWALSEGTVEVRAAAAEALGTVGSPQAVALLTTALRDRTPVVRAAAVRALGKTGTLAALAALRAAPERDPEIRSLIRSAAARIEGSWPEDARKLPRPAGAPAPDAATLPRIASVPEPEPDDLPLPADRPDLRDG